MTTTKNNKIYVQTQGSGQDVILLHSWCGSHRDWSKLAPELAQDYRLFAWDARGHANSPVATPDECSLINMADDLKQMIEDYQIKSPIIAAHSMGAFILWAYIERYGTDDLSKICILDQTPKLVTDDTWSLGIYGNFDRIQSDHFISQLKNDFANSVIHLAANGKNQTMREKLEQNDKSIIALKHHLQNQAPEPLINIWQNLTQVDFRDLVSKIDIPTLLIYGTQSNYYGEETAHYMHKTIKNSTLHLYKGADHSPHLRQADRFIADFKAFAQSENHTQT